MESREERIDVWRSRAESGDDRQIDILGETGLAPSLHRDGADEAELSVAVAAERLHLECRPEDRVQRVCR